MAGQRPNERPRDRFQIPSTLPIRFTPRRETQEAINDIAEIDRMFDCLEKNGFIERIICEIVLEDGEIRESYEGVTLYSYINRSVLPECFRDLRHAMDYREGFYRHRLITLRRREEIYLQQRRMELIREREYQRHMAEYDDYKEMSPPKKRKREN